MMCCNGAVIVTAGVCINALVYFPDPVLDADMKPFLRIFRNFSEVCVNWMKYWIFCNYEHVIWLPSCPISIITLASKDKSFLQETDRVNTRKQKFKKQVRGVTTFSEMTTHLEEIILWCKSEKMEKEKRRLKFLRLKCLRLKSLEAEGYK